MDIFRFCLFVFCLITLSACSGEKGGVGDNSSAIPASQIETAKLQAALKNQPAYKLDDSEISTLQNEGIINEADKAKLQSIQ